MAWYDNIIKDGIIMWVIRCFVIALALTIMIALIITIVRISQGKYVKFWGIEWNTNESKKSEQDKIETNINNTTHGNESPIMQGQGDYKPSAKTINDMSKKNKNAVMSGHNTINAKNVNTGVNTANIGDTYTGIQQRHFSEDDIQELLSQIATFEKNNRDLINHNHLTIGFPGDKETKTLALELVEILNGKGYKNIQPFMLQTYGVTGKLFGVSNAPDNSIMIEIYPADNVQ